MNFLCNINYKLFNKRFIKYCKKLKFEEKPDYNFCIKLFRNLMIRNNMEEDNIFDWMVKSQDTSQSSHLRNKLSYDKNFLPKLT